MKNWLATLGGNADLKLKTRDFIRGGLMATSLVWMLTGLALLLTRPLWWRESELPARRGKPLVDRSFAIGVGFVLLLAVAVRYPRMDLGLYNDEIDVFRTAMAGSFDRDAAADLTQFDAAPFKPVPWFETVWGNRIGNNHALHSVLARLGFDAWSAASGAVPGQIQEWPLRLPALFGGLVSILAAALVTRLATGSARAGWFVAFILAVHPWHVRYSTEARGYGLVFGFGTLAVLFLALAMRRHRWRWWLLFAACQALCLWAFIGAVYLIAAINLAALALMISAKKRPNPVGSAILPCWIVATILSAAAFFLMAAPILPPVRLALIQNATFQSGAAPNWWIDVLSYLFLGMPWLDHDVGNPANPATVKYLGNPLVWAGGLAAVIAAATGALRLWRGGTAAGRMGVTALVLGTVLPWLVSAVTSGVLLIWYVSYGAVFIGICLGAGFDQWVSALAENGRSPAWRRGMTYALLGLYAAAVTQPLMRYRVQSKQSLREAVSYVRGGVFPFKNEQLRPIVAGWWTHANYYDPHLRVAHTSAALQSLIERARGENRPLFFILGMRDLAAAEDPAVVARLEQSGDFDLERIFPGLEESQFRTHVFRLKENQKSEKSQRSP